MLDIKKFHQNIHELVPCLEHGYRMAGYISDIQIQLRNEDRANKKAEIEYLNFWERSLRGSLSQSDDSKLTNSQLSMFIDVQTRMLEFYLE